MPKPSTALVKAMPTGLKPFHGMELFGFRITPTGIELVDGKVPDFDAYESLGSFFGFMEGAVAWLIGSWIAFGEEHYGEKMTQAVDATGWDVRTVQQYAWVCDRVPKENRDPTLSFSHHRVVADLPPKQQKSWLKKAKSQSWSVHAFQREVNTEKHKGEPLTLWLTIGFESEEARAEHIKLCERKGIKVKA